MTAWHYRAMTDRDAAPTAPARRRGPPPRRRTLLVVRGDDVEARPLPLVGAVVVGRGADADIQIDDASLSRVHLVISLDPDGITVSDSGSANGTSLREVRLPVGVAVQISPNEPFAAGDVVLVVQEVGVQPIAGAQAAPRPADGRSSAIEPIVRDEAMRQLYALAARVARGTIGILLAGETGTGKEVLCEYIHATSPRGRGPLIRVNCAALADSLVEGELFGHDKGAFTGATGERKGLIEAADRGTVFLDEVGELPAALQAKLLRVLEDRAVTRVGSTAPRPIDVRFVAATNRDLESDVDAGRFRRDLYYRLAAVVLEIPPLRERPTEIEPLARAFVAAAAARLGVAALDLTDDAIAALRGHPWPGNVRELRNVVERAILVADGAIDRVALRLAPAAAAAPGGAAPAVLANELAELERKRILEALDTCGGNQTRAAELLGMPRRTLIKRLDEYGVPRPRK
jgi:two-component system, NtrC family, response regulator AtoC